MVQDIERGPRDATQKRERRDMQKTKRDGGCRTEEEGGMHDIEGRLDWGMHVIKGEEGFHALSSV